MRTGGALLGLLVLSVSCRLNAVGGVAVRLLAFAGVLVVALEVEHFGRTLVGFEQHHIQAGGRAVGVLGVHLNFALAIADNGEHLALDGDHREPTTSVGGQVGVEGRYVDFFQERGQVGAGVKWDDVHGELRGWG